MAKKPKVAIIGTGGTITSLSSIGPLDLFEYTSSGRMLEADEMVARYPQVHEVAEIVAIRFKAVPSTALAFPEWKQLVIEADKAVAAHPDLAGIVILHGTATLEETAYALNLTAKVSVPIVIVGAQRPASALSGDAGLNMLNAVRVAANPASRGLGVLVCLNDEIQAAREVTKTSTSRLQTFRAPDFGALGHADGDMIAYYRKPIRKCAPDTEFDIRALDKLPRVDIALSYAGNDGAATRAFIQAGAKGIVLAAFAPGLLSPVEMEVAKEAVAAGIVVVSSSRAGSGRAFHPQKNREAGFIPADNLTPQKARILLSLALTTTSDKAEIARMFATY
ncbi:MAG: asparaginase [Proteobacteria bacterium]|nr:asparaginase [Pseudomonadota bacterium]